MSAGGSSGSSDTRFSRVGTAGTTSFRDLTNEHTGRYNIGMDSTTPSATGGDIRTHVSNTVGKDQYDIPYNCGISQVIDANLPGTSVPGQSSLTNQTNINPYSSDYESGTLESYQKGLETSLSRVSGPAMTRGGTAAQGFMGQEVMSDAALNREQVLTDNRRADAQVQQGASNTLHGMQSRDTGEALQAIGQGQNSWNTLVGNQNSAAGVGNQQAGIYSDLVQSFVNADSVVRGNETNNLSGRGAQSSSSMGANISACCFIFMEAYHGNMPWFVRASRDLYAPICSDRREGYITMSKWLVPSMRVSKVARWLTNKLMIEPLTKYGGYEWSEEGYDKGWKYKPVVSFWFFIWKLLGKLNKIK